MSFIINVIYNLRINDISSVLQSAALNWIENFWNMLGWKEEIYIWAMSHQSLLFWDSEVYFRHMLSDEIERSYLQYFAD